MGGLLDDTADVVTATRLGGVEGLVGL